MSFDPRSLDRLRELGRKLPKTIATPEPPPETTNSDSKNKLHPIETEEDPKALFRELMKVSSGGEVPAHLIKRLKEAESKNIKQLEHIQVANENPASLSLSNTNNNKAISPKRTQINKTKEEKSLYTLFKQLLLEDEEDI